LEKLSKKDTEEIREKLASLLEALEETGVIPFNELDVKNLKGKWKGFLRLRISKIRPISKVDFELDELQVYEIDFRRSIYK